jgi:uncharacterized protein
VPDPASLTGLRADVATAARLVAPSWPLTSFVAVNPLHGLEHLPFDLACTEARRWMRARTHLPLVAYREARRHGAITDQELRSAIARRDPFVLLEPPVVIDGGAVEAIDIVLIDLVDGPVSEPDGPSTGLYADHTDPWVTAVRDYVGIWCAGFTAEAGAATTMPHSELGFYRAWRRLARRDPRLRQLIGAAERRWIGALPDDAAAALDVALTALGVDLSERIDVLRSLVMTVPGWAGYARWGDEWAPPDHDGAKLRMLDLVAVVAVIHAGAGRCVDVPPGGPVDESASRALRSTDAAARIGATRSDQLTQIGEILGRVPEAERIAIWLEAHELVQRDEILGTLDTTPAPTPDQAVAQLVACIDVRSEVLRRHLEAVGPYETFGFAGFFGVPVRWRPLGSSRAEARCPVLVTPRYDVAEIGDGEIGGETGGGIDGAGHRHYRAGAGEAFHHAKGGLGTPFALAEGAGWLLGPVAAVRTLARRFRPSMPHTEPSTRPAVAAEFDPATGLPLAERVLAAEAILTTINLCRFSPLVVLCGHGSHTINNSHAAALDCGACGGAAGGPSARVAAAILNDPEVREALDRRGITVPSTTWFVPAEHDTASDEVHLFDLQLVPDRLRVALDQLRHDLALAGIRAADERSGRLPGDRRAVRNRGRDWAQVRPEWGLAGNVAFVAAPRSATRGIDLGGRVFLHSYDAAADPEAVALETIMTAPLVVAQWINSQYYFSSVDPDVFGAGDKTIANPTGGIGALRGPTGDLAVGLPEQSVGVGALLAHQPVRLLAVIQAPIDRIEAIIQRNPGLRGLVENEWIHVVARAHERDEWMERTPAGTWLSRLPVPAAARPSACDPGTMVTR